MQFNSGFCLHDTAMPHGAFTAGNQVNAPESETARTVVSLSMYREETSRSLPSLFPLLD